MTAAIAAAKGSRNFPATSIRSNFFMVMAHTPLSNRV
jgi:hypothetical protein